MAHSNLHDRLLKCWYHGIAESTRQTYRSGLRKFESFCSQYAFTPAPASSLTLQYFCAYESQSVSYKTIKVYLAAIRPLHIENNMPDPTDDSLLHLVCRGIHHLQGDNQRTHYKLDAHNKGAATPINIHASRATNVMGRLHHGNLWFFQSEQTY